MKRIYVITNKINGKKYVGQTSYTLAHRFSQHKNNACLHTLIHEAIVEYGSENFTIEELCRCDSQEEADAKEIYYIHKLNTHHSSGGYNLGVGGDINPMFDSEVKARHRMIMSNDYHKEIDKQNIMKYNNSEKRKLDDIRTSERQRGIYNDNFRAHNEATKIPIDMIDDDGNILMHFDSCADACRYMHTTYGCKLDKSYSAMLQRYADKINKNGKRAKFMGKSWSMSNKES